MHRTGRLARSKDYPRTASCWFEELGLAQRLAEELDRLGAGDVQPALDGSEAALLLEILLATQEMFIGWERKSVAANLADLFTDPAVRRFLFLHWSGDTEWFNKERFELLVQWLPVAEAIAAPGTVKPAAARKLSVSEEARKEVMWLAECASVAGYQALLFLECLKEQTAE